MRKSTNCIDVYQTVQTLCKCLRIFISDMCGTGTGLCLFYSTGLSVVVAFLGMFNLCMNLIT